MDRSCMRFHDFQRPIATACIRQVLPASRETKSYALSPASVGVLAFTAPHDAPVPCLKQPHDTLGESIKGIGNVQFRSP